MRLLTKEVCVSSSKLKNVGVAVVESSVFNLPPVTETKALALSTEVSDASFVNLIPSPML